MSHTPNIYYHYFIITPHTKNTTAIFFCRYFLRRRIIYDVAISCLPISWSISQHIFFLFLWFRLVMPPLPPFRRYLLWLYCFFFRHYISFLRAMNTFFTFTTIIPPTRRIGDDTMIIYFRWRVIGFLSFHYFHYLITHVTTMPPLPRFLQLFIAFRYFLSHWVLLISFSFVTDILDMSFTFALLHIFLIYTPPSIFFSEMMFIFTHMYYLPHYMRAGIFIIFLSLLSRHAADISLFDYA